MKPWKSSMAPSLRRRLRIGLQWGHGDEAVEEAKYRDPTAGRNKLQLGHGDEAVVEGEQQGRAGGG